MKLRNDYTITILGFRNLAVITKKNNGWVSWLQRNATCGCSIYDCTFRQTVNNLKKLKKDGVDIETKR